MDCAYKTSKSTIVELEGSILGGSALNYVGHRDCLNGDRAGASKYWHHVVVADLDRQNELIGR